MSVTTAQAVTLLENVLFESSDIAQANAANWVSQSATDSSLSTVAGLAAALAATPEAGIAQQVVRYYMGALGRVPRGDEIQFYVNNVEQGLTSDQISQGTTAISGTQWAQIAAYFAASPEFSTDFGLSSAGQVNSTNEAAVIQAFYANILGRTADSSEVQFYETALGSGTSVATLVQYFTTSPEYQDSVNANIQTALGAYGTSIVNGGSVTQIPLGANVALGSTALTYNGTLNVSAVTVTGTAAATAQAAVTAVTGVIGVAAVTAATGVQGVTAVAAVTPVAGITAATAVTDGAVTINDISSSATGAGTIKSVSLVNSGAGSVINDNGLTSLTLIGTTGTVAITNINTAAIAAHASTLALTVNGLSASANAVTDTHNEISTLNVTTATTDSVLAGFADTNLTTLTVAGTNKLTLNAINSSLTSFTLSGAASFSDGATTHAGGLAALGSHLTLTDSSTGSFTAALDDTTQSFAGGAGAAVIMVSSLADATKTINAGSATTGNEIIFEGGGYALTSASSGKFVGFQSVGAAANVTGTIDLSVVDPTASGLEVIGANSGIIFSKAASGATLLLDPSAGATVTLAYADATGASDTAKVTMSSAVAALTLQDSTGAGVGTLTITNTLGATDTNVSPAHVIGTVTDNGLSTLVVTGTAGLSITTLAEATTPAASFTLNNSSTDGFGVTIGTFTDSALATLAFVGTGTSTINALNSAAASLSVTNAGANSVTPLESIGILTDNTLTSLSLAANVSLGQASTALTTNGLQDSSTAGVTISGGTDGAHVTMNLTAGAASGKTDAITLGNGNNVVVDASIAGTVNITLGTGANLVELGGAALDTTAKYNVTFTARTASAPNAVFVGTAGVNYASAPNLVITGASTGDIIAFGNDSASSAAVLTATSLTSATNVASAIGLLEAAVTSATPPTHKVVYGVYSGNTYIVESVTGTIGASDTTVVEVVGSQTLTASAGYVTLGSTASILSVTSGLVGAGFTIPAGTVYNTSGNSGGLILGTGSNVVTLVGPSTGITDTFVSGLNAGALIINYQATSGTDTILMKGSAGSNASDVTSLIVNDSSTGSAGLTIGAFTGNGVAAIGLTSVTYNNSAAGSAAMTQQALTSSTLNTINFTGGVTGVADNYFFTGILSPGTGTALTINDSNIGLGTAALGLTLTGGPSTLNLNMTGAGTLATGILPDDNLAVINIAGTAGSISVGTVTDAMSGTFAVNDTSTSSHANSIVLSGLSHATALTITDSSSAALTDSSLYSDANLSTVTLTNTGAGALTIGGGGLTMSAAAGLIAVSGSGTGSVSTGAIADAGGVLTITDSYAATGANALVNLPIDSANFLATKLIVSDSSTAPLTFGSPASTFVDNSLTVLSLTNNGSSVLTLGAMTANVLTELDISSSGTGSIVLGTITDIATGVTFSNAGTKAVAITQLADTAAAFTATIPSTSTGALAITLAGTGSGSLTISDLASSSVAFNIDTALTISIGNSVAGTTSTLSVNDTAVGSTAITLTGVGNQAFTLTDTTSGAITIVGTGSYSITLPTTATETINLPTTIAGDANTTQATAYKFTDFILDTGASPSVTGDSLAFGGFTSSNFVTAADVNSGSSRTWTIAHGMMSSTNATVLNFIAAVKAATTAGGAAVSGVAGFLDGSGNTWIAYNDHSGSNVSVVELVGVVANGLEAGAAASGYIHLA